MQIKFISKSTISLLLKNILFFFTSIYLSNILTSVDLPLVTSVGKYAFQHCGNLTSVNLPKVTSIGEGAFDYCSKLTIQRELNCKFFSLFYYFLDLSQLYKPAQ